MNESVVLIIVLAVAFIVVLVLLLLSLRSREKLVSALSQQQIASQAQSFAAAKSPSQNSFTYPSAPSAVATPSQPSMSVKSSIIINEDPDESDSMPAPVSELKDACVLMVEDDAELREYLSDELSVYVKEVYQAKDGIDATNVLNDKPVDIIISDVMMPRMDGFELCHYIKTTVAVSHIPVILLTARSDAESRTIGYKNGADDYITKPFDFSVLLEAIKRLFFGREMARNNITQKQSLNVVEVTFSSADEKFLKKFDEFINANIQSPDLDIKMLVEYMGMSRTVLFNKVKQLTGLNLQGYTNKVRMDHVKTLLTTTDLPIGEVARLSGFSSSRYLSTSFKNYTGLTPSEYKRNNQI